MNPRERDFIAKKEGKNDPKITPSSRQWSSHKNPRIVRVSRTFGGKDRHSKVCTVKGLRDRRIRLSVPTAVQLYDLQDRLGVGQPSKVVDWLLNATKNDIEKLPPLPMLPEEFSQNPKSSGLVSNINPGIVQENQEGFVAQNQLLFQNQFGFPNMPYNWDLPSLSLSHIGGGGGGYHLPNQSDVLSHNNLLPSDSQLYFPPYFNPLMDSLQNPLLPTTLHLISPPLMKPFYVNANSKTGHWQQNDNERREKKERS